MEGGLDGLDSLDGWLHSGLNPRFHDQGDLDCWVIKNFAPCVERIKNLVTVNKKKTGQEQ